MRSGSISADGLSTQQDKWDHGEQEDGDDVEAVIEREQIGLLANAGIEQADRAILGLSLIHI